MSLRVRALVWRYQLVWSKLRGESLAQHWTSVNSRCVVLGVLFSIILHVSPVKQLIGSVHSLPSNHRTSFWNWITHIHLADPPHTRSSCVLKFVNLSVQTNTEYLQNGGTNDNFRFDWSLQPVRRKAKWRPKWPFLGLIQVCIWTEQGIELTRERHFFAAWVIELYCSAKPTCSICSLVKQADTAFRLCTAVYRLHPRISEQFSRRWPWSCMKCWEECVYKVSKIPLSWQRTHFGRRGFVHLNIRSPSHVF